MTDWSAAGVVALTGILAVFAVLGLLSVAVIIAGKIFEARARSKKAGSQNAGTSTQLGTAAKPVQSSQANLHSSGAKG